MWDVIVVGAGVMGAATLAELARRGASVVGIEAQSTSPHARGSSHGQSRVFRKAYFEHPSYVPLLLRAHELWRRLGQGHEEPVMLSSGCLNIGPPEHECIRGVEASVREHGLPHQRLDADAIRARFGGCFAPRDSDVGIYEEDAGLLLPERCVERLLRSARVHGAELVFGERVVSIEPDDAKVVVRTSKGSYVAKKVVSSIGAWLGRPGAPLRYHAPLHAMRQVQHWFAPTRDRERFAVGRFPCFIHFAGEDRVFYGLPDHEGRGVKVCRHYGGVETEPDALPRDVTRADVDEVRGWMGEHLPDANGTHLDGAVCMYGLSPDAHFVIGPHPEASNVLLAGGFSGHGFKLAPSVGEVLAQLAMDGATTHDIALFDPARFAG